MAIYRREDERDRESQSEREVRVRERRGTERASGNMRKLERQEIRAIQN